MSIVYVADLTVVIDDALKLRINGYKTVYEDLQWPVVATSCLEEIYKLYSWSYGGGNISDKIGIVRNLLSLYAKNGIANIDEGVYSAARSNYEIYLKENIGRYLDVKNSIAEKILELSQKCTSYTESFGSYFKQSILAISTFFITIIVLAAIDKEKYGKVFTADIKHISLVLIFISFVHMVFTVLEYQGKCSRFVKEYNYLKETYKDVLDDKDIERIFDKDNKFNEDCGYLQSELAKYSLFWNLILVVLLVLVLASPTN